MKKIKNITSKLFLTIGGYEVDPPTGLRSEFQGDGALTNIIIGIFFYIIPIIGIIGFLFFLWSGFEYLTSKGDPKALAAAKARLTYAVVGIIVVFSAYLITLFVTEMFRIRRI